MKKILISEVGGAPSINVVKSIRAMKEPVYLIGISSDKYLLALADVDEKYLVPMASDNLFLPVLKEIIKKTRPDMIFSQNDEVVEILSQERKKINSKLFLPEHQTILLCHDKFASYQRWKEAKLPVPQTELIKNPKDLKKAFRNFGSKIWVRSTEGWSGKGAFCTDDYAFACLWIQHHQGWGKFTAAEYLSPMSVTWMSVWNKGELVIAQGRRRIEWRFGHHSVSGITGQTGVAVTISNKKVDEIAQRAIFAIDKKPHGIFSVDMTFDSKRIPNPTEINIGRFFTTAGLNMIEVVIRILLKEKIPVFKRKVNPLKPGLVWIRQIDVEPKIFREKEINLLEEGLKKIIISFS